MTFPLGSLRADSATTGMSGPALPAARWRGQAALLAGGLAWLLFVLALLTHQAGDPGFTTTGNGGPVLNKAGQLGAWMSDMAYFLFGLSAWWLVPVALRAWLSTLAGALRIPSRV